MTPFKTGARVFFENYGCTVPADLYSLENVVIIRGNFAAPVYSSDNATHTVTQVNFDEQWFHRSDIGITVVPCFLFQEL